ncbi:DNA mismatch endonuclease Vsr [Photobacterium sp. BZF1]|uniref:very short patch repair endonuclease n=1 Tax=Photobacterium sp. BZF1 TaxID=1904457 RepID=UPI001653E3D8|nr:very short patch repair endonuclease [Photobacterium sp. BZF1]MBC7003521.1 DNA mismatch endonuclease Vsr [Photobacterium sp. BZF1]
MPDMSLFPSKNTKLEVGLRKLIFSKGFRYRLHVKSLKGSPDLVFPKYKAVIFIHGCFWHCHNKCQRSHIPKHNRKFWLVKFRQNRNRDRVARSWLIEHGWRVLTIWECAVRNPNDFGLDELLDFIECWLVGGAGSCQVSGSGSLPMLDMEIGGRFRRLSIATGIH